MRTLNFIAGRKKDGPTVDAIRSPWNGEIVGEVVRASAQDMGDAIASAVRGFELARRLPTHARVSILEKTSRLIEARSDEFAKLIARESGKPIAFCQREVARSVNTFRLGAAVCQTAIGEVLPIDLETRGEGRLCLTSRVPRGPVAAIAPFNFPLNLIAHKLAPALAAGASVILKPPPQCPLTGFLLTDLILEAGWPPEALSTLHCDPATAQIMVEDDRMKVLSFTGSDVVGWKLRAIAGKKQVLLELGGNAPCIVDEGSDIDAILPGIVLSAFGSAGQVCIKSQRVLIHSSLSDSFLKKFVEATKKVSCGDPMDEKTVVGPMIEMKHVERVQSWIAEAVKDGAKLHCGGEAKGQLLTPAVLTDVKASMKLSCEEVFGPVTIVESFTDFDEAIKRCNSTRFGLQVGLFSSNLAHVLKAYRELDYGGVIINDTPTFRIDNFPYGGSKDSGFGREGVSYAVAEMTEPRVLILR